MFRFSNDLLDFKLCHTTRTPHTEKSKSKKRKRIHSGKKGEDKRKEIGIKIDCS